MSRRRASLVVIGLGRIGRLHAANLAASVRSAELVGVVDADQALARDVGERLGVAWSSSLAGLEPDSDGVVVAAPTRLHAQLVEQAAAAGKHVFCEKPLAFDLGPAAHAVAAARTAGVELQVGFQRRFDPDWLELKAALDSGQLGELELVRGSHRDALVPDVRDALGDVFVDVAVHDLDAARWLGGEVAELFALTPGCRVPTSASIALRFGSGAIGLIDVSRRAAYGFECSAELVGTQATMRAGHSHRRRDVELLRDGSAGAPLARDHAERHEAAYVAELEHFARVVLGGPLEAAAGADAVAALQLAKLAARSVTAGVPLAVEPLDALAVGYT